MFDVQNIIGKKILFARVGGNINKQELIERMANKTGMTKKDCGIALDSLMSTVTEALKESILGNEKR